MPVGDQSSSTSEIKASVSVKTKQRYKRGCNCKLYAPGPVLAGPLYARVPGILVGLRLLAPDNPGAGPVHHAAAALRPCTV